ncbi:MAG TPA: hypothetical protein VFB23_11965 [Candidatus Acidoferrales bacterium]|jgi:hypothetical protein|nr:hypothetical protein [Candidatus Acidoferrales bacterium]
MAPVLAGAVEAINALCEGWCSVACDPRGSNDGAGRIIGKVEQVGTPAVTFERIVLGYQNDGNTGKQNFHSGSDPGGFRAIANYAGFNNGEGEGYLAFGGFLC